MAEVYDPKHAPLPAVQHLQEWADSAFEDSHYADPVAEAKDKDRCIRMINGFVAQDDPADIEGTIATEVELEEDILVGGRPAYQLYAKLDRLVVSSNDPSHLKIIDYKTGRPRKEPDLDEALVQLWLAKLKFPNFRSFELQYQYVDEGGRCNYQEVTTTHLKGLQPILHRRALEVITSMSLEPQAYSGCSRCPLRPTCDIEIGTEIDPNEDIFGD